ncbi:MAG: DNA-3-methyladenine glycosylase 2 family protein [Clostridia bacterium]|nr:DNA-3-methyladenine glycosylase 2 family protein [Clostridia bacterium]
MKNCYIIECPQHFNLGLSLDCGQAFRWSFADDMWQGVAFGRFIKLQQTDNQLIIHNCTEDDFNSIWKHYFDFELDYEKILSSYDDEYLITAVKEYNGIRILRQEPWEALCSFIISQNNNIPRIKGIIERLCETLGDGEQGKKSFPSAEKLSTLTVDDLAPLRAGFRAKYILDAAQKVASGEIDFSKIRENPIEFGREELQKIKGVGAKVAECTLLYGFHKIEAFPVDVWVKRIMAEMYPDGLPECTKGTEGIAQQYLFHWRRMQNR